MRWCKHTLRIFAWQLDTMPEYSSTLPTGTTPFKMWKRCAYDRQAKRDVVTAVGQYHPVEDPERIGIRWFTVHVLEGPQPKGWIPPDWSNYERYRREAGFT